MTEPVATPEVEAALAKVRRDEQKLAAVTQQPPPKHSEAWWSATNAMTISATVLAFGVAVLLLAVYLVRIGKSSESVLRVFGTVLIIVFSVFLVVAGYDDKQIAPVIGLLGTIAGYLLGKTSSHERGEFISDVGRRPGSDKT